MSAFNMSAFSMIDSYHVEVSIPQAWGLMRLTRGRNCTQCLLRPMLLATPHTSETEHLIDEAAVVAMKPCATLVNIA